MSTFRGAVGVLVKAISIALHVIAITSIAFLATLYFADARMAKDLASSCVSCKRPSITITGPRLVDNRGRPAMKDWRIILAPETTEPKVKPELNPTEQQSIAVTRVNYYRGLVGVEPITLNSNINSAAQAHAKYNVEHDLSGHTQSPGDEGFTGVWPWDRLKHFSYDRFTYATEVCSTRWAMPDYRLYIDPEWAVDGWVDTVYHRLPIISPHVYEAGFGAEKSGNRLSYTMDFANPGFPERDLIICYPVDGQKDVPLDFPGDEKPDPLPGRTYPVGYPITVTFNGYADIKIEKIRLTDKNGTPVDYYKLLPFSDKYIRESLAIIPKEPLEKGMEYRVWVMAVADGVPVDLTWKFETAREPRPEFP